VAGPRVRAGSGWLSGKAVLGVPAAGDERTDWLAKQDFACAFAGRGHRAGDLEPRDIGRPGRRGIAAEPLEYIRPVDTGEGHFDENLPGAGSRHGTLLEPQDLRPAGCGDTNGLHRLRQSHSPCSPNATVTFATPSPTARPH